MYRIALLATLVALIPSSTFALDYNTATTAAAYADVSLATTSVTSYLGTLIQALFGLLGVIFLILTIYAGVLWMTAGGNTDNVKKAKQILGNATIGLILTLTSYAISYFVIGLVS